MPRRVGLTATAPRLLSTVKGEPYAGKEDHEEEIKKYDIDEERRRHEEDDKVKREPESSDSEGEATRTKDIQPTIFKSAFVIPPAPPKTTRNSSRNVKNEHEEKDSKSARSSTGAESFKPSLKRGFISSEEALFAGKKRRKTTISYGSKNFHAVQPKPSSPKSNKSQSDTNQDGDGFKTPKPIGRKPNRSSKVSEDHRSGSDSDQIVASSSSKSSSKKQNRDATVPKSKLSLRAPPGPLIEAPNVPTKRFISIETLSQITPTSTPLDPREETPPPPWEPEPEDHLCPLCGREVESGDLLVFRETCQGTFRQQQEFCHKHKVAEAEHTWEKEGYPEIDWDRIFSRLNKYRADIKRILAKPEESYFRKEMEAREREGNARTLLQHMKIGFDSISLGYYGTRGLGIIMKYITAEFAETIRKLQGSDKLIAARDASGYIQMVLAPELATLLVMEDMSATPQRAREILLESVEVGELLNGKDESENRRSKKIEYVSIDDDENDPNYWARTQTAF